jgi:preprotein translocase subunit SecY
LRSATSIPTVQYNPIEISNNLKKNGGFIPGFRPGRPTSDFIAKVINKIVLFGALYLGQLLRCSPLSRASFSAATLFPSAARPSSSW